MKKSLLTMLALMVAVVGANAQTVSSSSPKLSTKGAIQGMGATYRGLKTPDAGVVKPFARSVKPQKAISLDANEKIVGYFKSDEISENVGTTPQIGAGEHNIGTPFFSDVIGKAVTGQLTKARVQLAEPIGSTTVSVYTVDAEGYVSSEPATTGTIASTVVGWNDVTFDKPLTLEEGMGLFVTYSFSLANALATHNFLVDYDLNTDYEAGGIYLFGDYGEGLGLYTIYRDVNLCIQLVVKGGKFSDDDIILSGFIDKTLAKRGGNMDIAVKLKNDGYNIPSSYTLNFQVDGNDAGSVNTPVDLSDGSNHSYTYTLPLSADLSKTATHNVSVRVASINGKVPTVNTEDDKIDANIFVYGDEDVVAKQKTLVEQFTSSGCPNCPYGYGLLNLLNTKRDDLAWVSLHTDYGTVKDEYTNNFSNNLTGLEVSVFPSASFNRTYISEPSLNEYGSLAIGIGFNPQYYEQVANMFSSMIDQLNTDVPAFASVNIESEYNEDTRELKITVSGEGKADVQNILKDGALSVFLTEDGLKGLQYNNLTGQIEYDYPHDHVLRYAADGAYGFGEPINWTSGTAYSNEYTIKLDEDWNADNMNIVAFIGRPIQLQVIGGQAYMASEINDVWVSNAETVKLGETSTGIDNAVTVTDKNATEVARYALDGTQLSAPTKGVNIVKMSDGTTRKVIVK